MKRSLVRLIWLIGFIVVGCGVIWLIAPTVMFIAIIFCPSIVDQENPAYVAEIEIDGYTFEVTLIRNHPLLAEYRKILKIKHGGDLMIEKEFIDPGGRSSFYLLRRDKEIAVLDYNRSGVALDVKSGKVNVIDSSSLPDDYTKGSFGWFMFKDGDYKWVSNDKL